MTPSTTLEEFYIDAVTDSGVGTAPGVSTALLSDIARSSNAVNLRFQRVTVTIPSANDLVPYDWTPAEFSIASATACPYQVGFAVIPKTAATGTTGAACTSGSSQPAGLSSPSASEILIGTDFSPAFSVTSDCRCAKTASETEPSATSTITGTIAGFLVFDVTPNSSTGYYYLAPKANADANVTNTVAGM